MADWRHRAQVAVFLDDVVDACHDSLDAAGDGRRLLELLQALVHYALQQGEAARGISEAVKGKGKNIYMVSFFGVCLLRSAARLRPRRHTGQLRLSSGPRSGSARPASACTTNRLHGFPRNPPKGLPQCHCHTLLLFAPQTAPHQKTSRHSRFLVNRPAFLELI